MSTTQTLAIVFADVSGSTRLFEQRGDVEARRLISAVISCLSEITCHHGGRVVKTIGDEVMATFPGAAEGVRAACEMQRRVSQDMIFARDNLGIRIGMHVGEVLLEEGDVFGDAVNIAARMASLAKRDQIVTTAATFHGVTQVGEMRSRRLGRARVSGKLLPIDIVDVIWQEDVSNITLVQSAIRLAADADRSQVLTLRFRGQVIELSPTSSACTMGRDATNRLVIDAEWVSRLHASIEFKNGNYVLSDRSTNGTFIQFGDDEEVRIHREDVLLRKAGAFSLGQSIGVGPLDIVYFHCA